MTVVWQANDKSVTSRNKQSCRRNETTSHSSKVRAVTRILIRVQLRDRIVGLEIRLED
jgi:hypothetical protein